MGLLVLHLSGLVLNAYVTHVSEAGGAEGWDRQPGTGRERWNPLAGLPVGEVWGQDLLKSVGEVHSFFTKHHAK